MSTGSPESDRGAELFEALREAQSRNSLPPSHVREAADRLFGTTISRTFGFHGATDSDVTDHDGLDALEPAGVGGEDLDIM